MTQLPNTNLDYHFMRIDEGMQKVKELTIASSYLGKHNSNIHEDIPVGNTQVKEMATMSILDLKDKIDELMSLLEQL